MSRRSALVVAVGWLSETHRAIAASNTESVGFASLNPPYKARPRRRLHGELMEDKGKPRMSEQFQRRLAAARHRAVAEKQRAEKQAAAERQTLDQLAGLQRAALRQWHKRIFPLIKQVVETANKELRGSGMRLIVAEDYVRVIAFADIFGAPEAKWRDETRAPRPPSADQRRGRRDRDDDFARQQHVDAKTDVAREFSAAASRRCGRSIRGGDCGRASGQIGRPFRRGSFRQAALAASL